MKFLANIDLTKNELKNAKVHISTSDIGTPAEGQIYYNSTDKVLKFYTGTSWIVLGTLNQISAPTADIDMDTFQFTNLQTPTVDTNAATKAYVDSKVAGLSWKQAVRVATTANGTLATDYENGDSVDGVILDTGDRILIKDNATSANKGIYVVAASGAPSRATDFDSGSEADGAAVFVMEGTTNGNTQWIQTADAVAIGADAQTWTQFGASTGIADGDKGDIVVSGSGTVWSFDTSVVTAAAKTVLDDATVAAMVNTLGGASSTGTGGLVRASSPTLVAPTLGAASATSLTLTNDLAITDGGTGQSSAYAAYDALSIHGADVASAGTIDLDAATGNLIDVTGTTTITAITLAEGRERTVRFTGALTLTHGASLVLPGGVNRTTVAGDYAIFRGYAAGVVRCVLYSPITVTGTGSTVLHNGPTFVTPVLGNASATTINNITFTQPIGGATLTLTTGTTVTGPAASGTLATLGNTETFTGVKTFGSAGAVGRLKIAGTTSGAVTVDAPATAGSGTVTVPLAGQIPAIYGTLIGDNSTTAIVVTHNLSSRDVLVSVHDATTYEQVWCDVEKTSTSTVTLTFVTAPTTNQYRAIVVGA